MSSGFGYLIIDSKVAPHDKMDVSRQSIKTIHITLKNVSGNVVNLHGANCSFSMVFVATEELFNLIFDFLSNNILLVKQEIAEEET